MVTSPTETDAGSNARPHDRIGRIQAGAHRGWRAGGHAGRALCDGDAGLWRLQCEALPKATIVLDWWHAAVRFEHALQAAHSLDTGTARTHLADETVRCLEASNFKVQS